MSRPIKFTTWDKVNRKWLDGVKWEAFAPNDKNGKEIYQRYIVKFTNKYDEEFVLEVKRIEYLSGLTTERKSSEMYLNTQRYLKMTLLTKILVFLGYRSPCCLAKTLTTLWDWKLICGKCGKII